MPAWKQAGFFQPKLRFQGRTDLHQWPGLALHCKPEVAELTVAGVGGRQPALQAAAVDGAQRPRALAGGQQLLVAAALVADPTDGPVIEGAAAGEGEKTAGQCSRVVVIGCFFLCCELEVLASLCRLVIQAGGLMD